MVQNNDTQLIGELLQQLATDQRTIQQRLDALDKQAPAPDYGPQLKALQQQLEQLQADLKKDPSTAQPSPDLSSLAKQVKYLIQLNRERPEYRLSQYVQWGGYVFGLLVVLVAVLTWKGLEWKTERDHYEQAYSDSEWRVRYTRQANAEYYAYMEGQFSKDPAGLAKWVIEQEQADQKRELARQASEQAKALSTEADQLESKRSGKGKKKGSN